MHTLKMPRKIVAVLLAYMLCIGAARAGVIVTRGEGIVLTGTEGITFIDTSGITATGTDALVARGVDAMTIATADGITVTGTDGITATGTDGITATGTDAQQRTGLQSVDPLVCAPTNRASKSEPSATTPRICNITPSSAPIEDGRTAGTLAPPSREWKSRRVLPPLMPGRRRKGHGRFSTSRG
ncbi:MAG TPA: hypothetical protein VGB61_06145 [Pyrinomonadaceae bacterium]|jgi:hypothetical protein